jgi:hypothetical protein
MLKMLFATVVIGVQELGQVQDQLGSSTQLLQSATAARPLTGQQQLNLQLTQVRQHCCTNSPGTGCLICRGQLCCSASLFCSDKSEDHHNRQQLCPTPCALQLQKQLASTAALDGCLRSVGAAYAALMGRAHKEGATLAAQFLVDASGGPGVVTSKVLKLGDCSMKQLRNGDVYKVGSFAVLLLLCLVCRILQDVEGSYL